MTKKSSAIRSMKMPNDLRDALGPPPLLKHEEADAYESLIAGVAASIDPSDDVEWLLVKDIVDYSWQIRRYRQFAAGLMNSGIRSEFDNDLRLPDIPESITRKLRLPLLGEIVEREPTESEVQRIRDEREALTKERKRNPYLAGTRDYNAIHAAGFLRVIDNIERIEALIDSAEGRRNGAYKMLEQYRAQREGRRRSPSIIASQFKDVSSGNAAAE
jgi:hypothetical protein